MDQLNVQEDLAFIKKVMNDTKQSFMHDGMPFIVWGILVFIGQVATYYFVLNNMVEYDWYMWGILAFIGWFWSFLSYRRKKISVRATTITERAINAVWGSCGVTMMILIFLAPAFRAYHEVFIDPLACAILGIAYYVTGSITYRWMRYTAVGWWLGAVIMIIWPGLYEMLLLAALVVFFQIIPGFIINSQWKKVTALN